MISIHDQLGVSCAELVDDRHTGDGEGQGICGERKSLGRSVEPDVIKFGGLGMEFLATEEGGFERDLSGVELNLSLIHI